MSAVAKLLGRKAEPATAAAPATLPPAAARVATDRDPDTREKRITEPQASAEAASKNEAVENLPADVPAWGPKMAALANDRQRRFVCFLFEAPKQNGRLIWAARMAGYGTETSNNKTLSVIASRLNLDDRIQVAVQEEALKRRTILAPGALAALERLIDQPKHKDHARGIAMVLDRTDPVQTTHTVRVEDTRAPSIEATEKVLKRIDDLARRAGLVPRQLPVIDGEFQVVRDGAAQ
jgi:hypothetical protein